MNPCQSSLKNENTGGESMSMLGNILPTGDPSSKQPCYIMCLDSSGMLFRLPISLLKNQGSLAIPSVNSEHKVNEGIFSNINNDNAKPPIAIIPPFNTQNNSNIDIVSKLQQSNDGCYQSTNYNAYANSLVYPTDSHQQWSSDNLYQQQNQMDQTNRQSYLLNDGAYYQNTDQNTPEVSEFITIDQGVYSTSDFQMNSEQSTKNDQEMVQNLNAIVTGNKGVNLENNNASFLLNNQMDQNYLTLFNNQNSNNALESKKIDHNLANNSDNSSYGASLNSTVYRSQNTFQSLKFGEGFKETNQWQNFQNDASTKLLMNVQSNNLFGNSSKMNEFGSLTTVNVINNAQQKLMFVNSNLCKPRIQSSFQGYITPNQNISTVQTGQINSGNIALKTGDNLNKKSMEDILKSFGGNVSALKENASAELIAKLLLQSKQFLSKSNNMMATSQNNSFIQHQAPTEIQFANHQLPVSNANRLINDNNYMQYTQGIKNQAFKKTPIDLNILRGAYMSGNNRMNANLAYNQPNLSQNILNQNVCNTESTNMNIITNQTINQNMSFDQQHQNDQVFSNCDVNLRQMPINQNINLGSENIGPQMRYGVPGNMVAPSANINNLCNVNNTKNITKKATQKRTKSTVLTSNIDVIQNKVNESVKLEGTQKAESTWRMPQDLPMGFSNSFMKQVTNVQSNVAPSFQFNTNPQQQLVNSSPNNLQSESSFGSAVCENAYVPGQEYNISYSNGRQVTAVWDGKYFKIKQPLISNNNNPSTLSPQIASNNLSTVKNNTSCNTSNFLHSQNMNNFHQDSNLSQNIQIQNSNYLHPQISESNSYNQALNTNNINYTQIQNANNNINYTQMQNSNNSSYTQMLNTSFPDQETTSFTQMLNAESNFSQNSFQPFDHQDNNNILTHSKINVNPSCAYTNNNNEVSKKFGNEMRDQSYSSNLSSFSQDSLNSRPPIQSSKIQDSNSNIAADKFPKKQTEEGKFAVCRRCGHMSLNYTMCESCGRSLPEDVQFFMPEKKIKTGDNTINNLQTTPVKTLNPRKSIQKPGAKGTGSKRSTFGLRKETDVVHILSSDDEDKVNQQPAISHNCLKSISELGGCAPSFSIQLTDVYFGKIHCSTIKTCTAEADRITLSGVGPSGNIIKLISTSLELMLLAAFFQPKACSHVFLHTHFTSALKFIRETVPNSTVLYDSDCQDDCAKYIVLFLKHEDQSEGLETRIPETVAAMQQYRRAKSSNANQHIGPQYKTIDSFDVAAFMNSVRSSGSVELEIPSSVGIEEMEGIEGEEQMHSTNKMRSATFSSNIIKLKKMRRRRNKRRAVLKDACNTTGDSLM